MSTGQAGAGTTRVSVGNVGGIESTDVAFSPGATLLVGRNATNRTSFLRALQAACGSDDVSLKGDADQGWVELVVDGETYAVELSRTNGDVRIEGDPYLEDPTEAELFAFLLGSNEARRAVGGSEDLSEFVMRPVDVDEIEAEISRLVEERQEVDRSLAALEDRKAELPEHEERRTRLEEEIEATREELADLEAEIEAEEADLEETRAEKAELDERLSALSEHRSLLEDVRYRIDTEQESLEELRAERADLEAEREDLPEAPSGEIDGIETRLGQLRDRKQRLESEVSDFQRLIQFNREMLDEEGLPLEDNEAVGGEVTEQLLADGTVQCWTCGNQVDTDQIEATVERLQTDRESTAEELAAVREEIDELSAEREELATVQGRRDELDRRLRDLEQEIERTDEELETLAERRESLTEEVADLEAAVEELDEQEYGDVIEIHKRANQLEYELGQLENDRERVSDRIAEIEAEIEREDDIEARRAEIQDQIQELRTRIERIEAEVVEAFNEHMDQVLDLLAYENIERIWLERIEREGGRGGVSEAAFSLHVVRTTDSGVSYEDAVEHLSESERELTGLVFALAGYLAHEVYETVPFMLLDSVEAIDAERIAAIVDYLREYPSYLLVALLPEDAAAVDDDYERISIT